MMENQNNFTTIVAIKKKKTLKSIKSWQKTLFAKVNLTDGSCMADK